MRVLSNWLKQAPVTTARRPKMGNRSTPVSTSASPSTCSATDFELSQVRGHGHPVVRVPARHDDDLTSYTAKFQVDVRIRNEQVPDGERLEAIRQLRRADVNFPPPTVD